MLESIENVSREAVMELIPHREPFLFVDRIIHADAKHISAEYTYKQDEFFFKGHFPQYPVVPGVILVESMAQCGGAGYCALHEQSEKKLFLLGTASNCKFRRQVRPGETVRFEVDVVKCSSKLIKQSGKAYVGDELTMEASWVCFIVPDETAKDQ